MVWIDNILFDKTIIGSAPALTTLSARPLGAL